MVYISKKYKTRLRGKKTQIQNRCPHCGLDLRMFDFDYGDMYDNAIGFHDNYDKINNKLPNKQYNVIKKQYSVIKELYQSAKEKYCAKIKWYE